MTDLDKLKAAAEAATQGQWHWEADAVKGDPLNRVRYQVVTVGKTITQIYYSSYEGGPTNAEDDAKFIAAANPAVVLELIRRVEEAEAAIDEQMVVTHLGVFNPGDDPKAAIHKLMCWSQDVGAFFAQDELKQLRALLLECRSSVQFAAQVAPFSIEMGALLAKIDELTGE